ncbi:hypothetical protein POPTR_010G155701v4 [Populus trichocarpa]|uniref:Uncharacterized protein n=1 Tax=Populus trichocarpa TaxID=3694 RepID=A0ACC0SFN1_POPTR|nr:hypothetical protein POPTR_010G155701v4 [Populus trichocarpa]
MFFYFFLFICLSLDKSGLYIQGQLDQWLNPLHHLELLLPLGVPTTTVQTE